MSKRGFTLIELITSTAIMIVAIAATCMMLIEGQRFTRNSEEIINSNEGSRVAGEFIVSALRIAGMGAAAELLDDPVMGDGLVEQRRGSALWSSHAKAKAAGSQNRCRQGTLSARRRRSWLLV